MAQQDKHKIVILEADQERRDYLRSIISEWGYRPFSFGKESSCLDNISPLNPDLVISGPLPVDRAYRFINTVKTNTAGLPIVIISDDRAILNFVDTNGFNDVEVIRSKLVPAEIQNTVKKALANGRADNGNKNCPLIIGNSSGIIKIKKMIPDLNRLTEPILLQGEAGAGKELVARVIHGKSERWDKPFVKINAAEIRNDIIDNNRVESNPNLQPGDSDGLSAVLAAADTGTLFFDEIGAISPDLQARLLHFFKGGGALTPSRDALDIRIVASTRTALGGLIETGKFRKDLYFRLNVITIGIPALRERREDIASLTDFFADKYCFEFGKGHIEMSHKIKEVFNNHFWPGNVRELEYLIRTIVLRGNEDPIIEKLNLLNEDHQRNGDTVDAVYSAELARLKRQMQTKSDYPLKDIGKVFFSRVEKKMMEKALELSKWNRKKAADMLDISYKSLLNKIKEYKLN